MAWRRRDTVFLTALLGGSCAALLIYDLASTPQLGDDASATSQPAVCLELVERGGMPGALQQALEAVDEPSLLSSATRAVSELRFSPDPALNAPIEAVYDGLRALESSDPSDTAPEQLVRDGVFEIATICSM